MGNYKLKKTSNLLKILLTILLSFFLIIPGVLGVNQQSKQNKNFDRSIIDKVSKKVEIPAGSDYYIKFDSEQLKLEEKLLDPYTLDLSEKEISAIAKSPKWIQRDLTRQFKSIENAEDFADLILEMSKQYTDEIAFSIACSPLGNVPSVNVIKDNALFLYENDKLIDYADIIDYDNGDGDYFSTVGYKIVENDTEKHIEYPREIYYWYIVHPDLGSEEPDFVYDMFWREYLFNHNDLGYPLLKEKVSNIEYLWDCKSYSQPANRLWKWSIENHPTAIEAVSYWIGKTVPNQATGDRPGQPNIIAHQHNGWCGELHRLAVAAQRTILIPTIGANNVGEDHVWREFYERGWHQNDNWWSDGGGTVDDPDVYSYGWGKDMSAIFAWKGDDSIYDLTPTYIRPEDRNTIKFVIRDSFLQPVDGARVSVLVVGIKDITWLKNSMWEILQFIWDKLPDFVKGKILQSIYEKLQNRINEIPDIIDGLTISTWNYSDMNGECIFELGKNLEYLFIIQQGKNLRKPWQIAKNNAIRIQKNSIDKTYNIFFVDFQNKVQKHSSQEIPPGECDFDINFDVESYQLQKNVRTDHIGTYNMNDKIDFIILDEENFEKYQNRRRFNCFNYIEEQSADFSFSADNKDWYIIFRNHAKRSSIVLDFSIQISSIVDDDFVKIVSPDTNIFNNPMFNVGDNININGISTDDISLYIDNVSIEIEIENFEWFYEWNTTNLEPKDYVILSECNQVQDEIIIRLIDEFPPDISIDNPFSGEIFEGGAINISGTSHDNYGIDSVMVAIDDNDFLEATGTNNWFIEKDISNLDLGDHQIFVKAIDLKGKDSIINLPFVKNESGHSFSPEINDFYHIPENPTNISNVIIYANVTKNGPFNLKSVVLYYNTSSATKSFNMYEYASSPVQDRHEEDPLINEPNDPIYGFELGQFETGQNIVYWIVAVDSANNYIQSNEKNFTID